VLVAALPPGCDLATTYTAAVVADARSAAPARRLIGMLSEEARGDARRRLGFA
jgi:molybdate transport system substrate-binding protein